MKDDYKPARPLNPCDNCDGHTSGALYIPFFIAIGVIMGIALTLTMRAVSHTPQHDCQLCHVKVVEVKPPIATLAEYKRFHAKKPKFRAAGYESDIALFRDMRMALEVER